MKFQMIAFLFFSVFLSYGQGIQVQSDYSSLNTNSIDIEEPEDDSFKQLKAEEVRLIEMSKIIEDSLILIRNKIKEMERVQLLKTVNEKNKKLSIKTTVTGDCPLRTSLKPFDYAGSNLKTNDEVTLLDYKSKYWFVITKDSTLGYIKETKIIETPVIAKLKEQFIKINEAKEIEFIKENELREAEIQRIKDEEEKVNKQKKAEEKKKIVEIKKKEFEKNKPKNLSNTGAWIVKNFVDKFGEKTSSKYISMNDRIIGKFSNTATQNSKLAVELLIEAIYTKGEYFDNIPSVSLFLYEYAGNNPVKAYNKEIYSVAVQDKKGNRYELQGTNYSDRLIFSESDSKIIHEILLEGGLIKFKIINKDTPTTNYYFEISNANFYMNAYYKLLE